MGGVRESDALCRPEDWSFYIEMLQELVKWDGRQKIQFQVYGNRRYHRVILLLHVEASKLTRVVWRESQSHSTLNKNNYLYYRST